MKHSYKLQVINPICVSHFNPAAVDILHCRSPQHENGHRGRSRSRSRSRSPNRRSRPVQNRRLYISNMPFDMKWKDVKDLFKEQGW